MSRLTSPSARLTRLLSRLLGPVARLVAVCAALIGLVVAFTVPTRVEPSPPAAVSDVAVATSLAVCVPDPDDTEAAIASLVPALDDVAREPAGTATVVPLAGDSPVLTTGRVGVVDSAQVDVSSAGALVAQATGSWAPGYTSALATRSDGEERRGLAGLTCPAPARETWLVGGPTTVGRRGQLALTNPDDLPGLVDVTLIGPAGVVETTSGESIAVAARDQRVLLLDALAPELDWIAVRVTVLRGRVSAALRQAEVQGLIPLGTDWVPPAAAPEHDVLVPGLPGGPGERRLRVVVPGDRDATVRIELLTPDGPRTPPGLDRVTARAGRVTEVDLTAAAAEAPATVRLGADVPITAGAEIRMPNQAGGGELAYAAAAAPLTGTAVVLDPLPVSRTVLLSAPDSAARVRLAPVASSVGAGAVPAGDVVSVPAGSTVAVPMPDGGAGLVVVPERGSGPVVGARIATSADGAFITAEPLRTAQVSVPLPAVRADLGAAVGP